MKAFMDENFVLTNETAKKTLSQLCEGSTNY